MDNTDTSMYTKYDTHKKTLFSWIHPSAIFLLGMVCIIPYMMTDNMIVRIIQVTTFFLIASQIKHVRIFYFVFLTITITIFYLIKPEGRILFEYGFIIITEGALYSGAFRGITLMGYVFLSLWCISPELKLPTKYGKLLSESIMYFDNIIDISTNTNYKNFIREQRKFYSNDVHKKNNNDGNMKVEGSKQHIGLHIINKTDFLLEELIHRVAIDQKIESSDCVKSRSKNSTDYKNVTLGIGAILLLLMSSWLEYVLGMLGLMW